MLSLKLLSCKATVVPFDVLLVFSVRMAKMMLLITKYYQGYLRVRRGKKSNDNTEGGMVFFINDYINKFVEGITLKGQQDFCLDNYLFT